MVALSATFGMALAAGPVASGLNIAEARSAIIAAVRAAGGGWAASKASTRSAEELAGAGAAEADEEGSWDDTADSTRTRLARNWQSSPWLDTSESLASESSFELDDGGGLGGGGLRRVAGQRSRCPGHTRPGS